MSGIHDDKMLRDLLKDNLEDLTFQRAVTKCIAHEQANNDVHDLRGEVTAMNVSEMTCGGK